MSFTHDASKSTTGNIAQVDITWQLGHSTITVLSTTYHLKYTTRQQTSQCR